MTTVYCSQLRQSNTDLKDEKHIWLIPLSAQLTHSSSTKYTEYLELGWSTMLQEWVHTVPALDTVLLPSFLKIPVIHREMEQRKFLFPVILFPCFLLASVIYCRFYYMLKYDFNANFKASPLQLQSLAVNNRRGKLNSQQLSALPFTQDKL